MRKLLMLALALAPATAFAHVSITIINADGPGEGFNDPTPVAPVGGNPGFTLGQQRLFAFQYAASVWGQTLDSVAPIRIFSNFDPLTCTATAATLGSAGGTFLFADFPGALLPGTLYSAALTGKLYGADPLADGTTINNAHIRARFNSNLGNTGCLTGTFWYLGVDNNHGNNIDLVTVLLHEFGHGLGFQTFANTQTGALLAGYSDAFLHWLADNQTNKTWESMTNAQRATSAKNGRHLIWTGPEVTAKVPTMLAPGTPLLRVNSPAGIAGNYAVGTASFGNPLTAAGVTGAVVLGLDAANAAGPSTTDGCTAFTNDVAGKIVVVDRGTCGFIVKAANAQAAHAVAMLVADNAAGSPPAGLGGVDPTLTIPSVRITLADGNTIKAQLGAGVNASLLLDMAVRSGADAANHALMYAVDPFSAGSSVSHFDTLEFPNVLMEPFINSDLTHGLDLTLPLLRDIGWYPDADLDFVPDTVDACLGSDLGATVVIDGCDSGVTNWFFEDGANIGCTVADLVDRCVDGAKNHGAYASCASKTTTGLLKSGVISDADKDAIQSCAGSSSLP